MKKKKIPSNQMFKDNGGIARFPWRVVKDLQVMLRLYHHRVNAKTQQLMNRVIVLVPANIRPFRQR